jgi:hypothetical protein
MPLSDQSATLKIPNGLLNFMHVVHHKRTVLSDRLTKRFTG